EEITPMALFTDREKPSEQPHGEIVLRIDIDLFLARQRHLDAGVDQEGAENVENPMKAGDDADTDEDEHRAHDHRADDAPEQHAVLIARRHLEIGEDENENENVVDAQAELD